MSEETPERKAKTGPDAGADTPQDVEIVIVMGSFQAKAGADDQLMSTLSKYVVLSRMQPGCRNIDLVTSVTTPGWYLVYEKWESFEHQKAHFDSDVAVEMAEAVLPLLAESPVFDLFDPITAHDLV